MDVRQNTHTHIHRYIHTQTTRIRASTHIHTQCLAIQCVRWSAHGSSGAGSNAVSASSLDAGPAAKRTTLSPNPQTVVARTGWLLWLRLCLRLGRWLSLRLGLAAFLGLALCLRLALRLRQYPIGKLLFARIGSRWGDYGRRETVSACKFARRLSAEGIVSCALPVFVTTTSYASLSSSS